MYGKIIGVLDPEKTNELFRRYRTYTNFGWGKVGLPERQMVWI